MNDNQSYHMKRSFKYMCFQNQAHHFSNLMNSKHCIENRLDSKSPVYKKMSPQKQVGSLYKMNQKRRKEVDRIINHENQKLLKKLQEIMDPKGQRGKHSNQDNMIYARLSSAQNVPRSSSKNSNYHQLPNTLNNSYIIGGSTTTGTNIQRSQSPVSTIRNGGQTVNNLNNSVILNQNSQNGTTNFNSTANNFNNTIYNQNTSNNNHNKSNIFNSTSNTFNSTYKRQSELNTIERENFKIAKKITDCKPAVGTIDEWNSHYQKFKQNSSIRRVITSSGHNSAYDSQQYLPQQSNYSPARINQQGNKPYICIPNQSNMQTTYQDFIKKNKLYQNGNQIDQQKLFASHFQSVSRKRQRNISAYTGSINNAGNNSINGGGSQTGYQSPVVTSVLNDRYASSQNQSQKSSQIRLHSSQVNTRNHYRQQKMTEDGDGHRKYHHDSNATAFYDHKQNQSNTDNPHGQEDTEHQKHRAQFAQNYNTMMNHYSDNKSNNNNTGVDLFDATIVNNKEETKGYASQENLMNNTASSYLNQQKWQKKKGGKNSKSKNRLDRSLIDPRSIEFEKLRNTHFDFRTNSMKYAHSHSFGINNLPIDNYVTEQQKKEKHKRILSDLGFSDEDDKKINHKKLDEISGLINVNMVNENENGDEIENSDNYDEKIKQIQERYIKLESSQQKEKLQQSQILKQSATSIKNKDEIHQESPLKNNIDDFNVQLYPLVQNSPSKTLDNQQKA